MTLKSIIGHVELIKVFIQCSNSKNIKVEKNQEVAYLCIMHIAQKTGVYFNRIIRYTFYQVQLFINFVKWNTCTAFCMLTFFTVSHSVMFKCGGLRYTSTLSKFSWLLCWYSCNFRESENNVWPPEFACWPPRMKKDEVLDILAVSECQIIPATCRSWSFLNLC